MSVAEESKLNVKVFVHCVGINRSLSYVDLALPR